MPRIVRTTPTPRARKHGLVGSLYGPELIEAIRGCACGIGQWTPMPSEHNTFPHPMKACPFCGAELVRR